MKHTHYIVQTGEYTYARYANGTYDPARERKDATHLTLSKARDIYELERRLARKDSPLRFPRIIKVTTEYKTITTNRR